jgi:hypothetical protein
MSKAAFEESPGDRVKRAKCLKSLQRGDVAVGGCIACVTHPDTLEFSSSAPERVVCVTVSKYVCAGFSHSHGLTPRILPVGCGARQAPLVYI